MTSNQVAQTILQQLGGNKFIAMTGAKSFVGGTDRLMFALPANFAKAGINKVRITLTADDLYNVEFMKIRGVQSIKVIGEVEGVYAEDLRRVFTDQTGLDTHI